MKKRKILIWLGTFTVVLLVYLAYNVIVETPDIHIQQTRQIEHVVVPEFDEQSPKIAGTNVGNVALSRFTILNPETKKIKRVFGFEKVLNPDPGSEKWNLHKPYMNIYGRDFRCDIVSDKGTVQVEEIAGKPSPTDARLYDNVVIKIHSDPASGFDQSTIYLEDLVYSSQRSEFATNRSVKLVSKKAKMTGTGMILIYNAELGRLEYLRIIDLHKLTLYTTQTKSAPDKPTQTQASAKAEERKTPETPASSDAQPTAPAEPPQPEQPEPKVYYQCQLSDNVVVDYSGKMIVESKEHLLIKNILWSDEADAQTTRTSPASQTASVDTDKTPVHDAKAGTPAAASGAAEPTEQPSDEGLVEIVVTCSGGMIIKPVASSIDSSSTLKTFRTGLTPLFFAEHLPRNPSPPLNLESANLTGQTDILEEPQIVSQLASDSADLAADSEIDRRDRFYAEKIDYDMITGNGLAHGPVKFVFYRTQPAGDVAQQSPVVVTATENAEFFTGRNRIVFNGNVVGRTEDQTPQYIQKDSVHGQKLIVDLAADQTSDQTDIRHITVLDGNVKLESIRTAGDVAINKTRLKCLQLDYDAADKLIIAAGPGQMWMNNENAPASNEKRSASRKIDLSEPCYAYMNGFDKLKWFTSENKVTAGGKERSVFMSYIPIIDGEKGSLVTTSTTHMTANFEPSPAGQNQLADMTATAGVYYKETDGYEFMGNTLFYSNKTSWITITGSDRIPCYLDGVRVPKIDYNLETGKVKTKLSATPGTVSTKKAKPTQKAKPRRKRRKPRRRR